jgi:hypothetical protein
MHVYAETRTESCMLFITWCALLVLHILLNQTWLGLAVGAQAGAGHRREEGEPEEVEAEPRRRAAAPGTAGNRRGSRSRRLGRIARRESLERAREGDGSLQKRPPLACYSYLAVKLPGRGFHSAPHQQIRCNVASGDRVWISHAYSVTVNSYSSCTMTKLILGNKFHD